MLFAVFVSVFLPADLRLLCSVESNNGYANGIYLVPKLVDQPK